MIPADFHIHTHHSGDSEAPMDAVIESAIKKGLPAICITEHMDFDYPETPDLPGGVFEVDTDEYRKEFLSMKSKYGNRIKMFFGIELGMQPQIVKQNSDYVKSYPFDFVIGSNHLCHGEDPYYPAFYEGRSESEAYRDFFESTLENIKLFNDFDVLGHLDYIVRYAPSLEAGYNYLTYKEIIDEILKEIISGGKGLDVNTKSLYTNSEPAFKNPNPCRDILLRYKEMGGEIITFGSDAHKAKNVAGAFNLVTDIVKGCGFTAY
nr:histidinol-phosphatase HisJ family protein [Butyrivibrio sp.]